MNLRLLIFPCLALIGACVAAQADRPATPCDLLAAFPADPNRPKGATGAVFGMIDAPKAVRACEEALEKKPNSPRYQYQYGRSLLEAKRYKEAFRVIQRAANQGYKEATAALGYFYLKGHGAPQDHKKAAQLFREAAEQGSALGQHNLAVAYQKGFGVPKDEGQAENFYRKSAEQGYSVAQFELGRHFLGVQPVKALMWFTIAATYGNRKAPEVRDNVIRGMPPEQKILAERMAREWLNTRPP